MNEDELISTLRELNLTQTQFAALIGTSVRTVNLWATGQRLVSEPAASYLRLLNQVPRSFLTTEKNRLIGEKNMAEGMYQIQFAGSDGTGAGILVLNKGAIFGIDNELAKYDGEYEPSSTPGLTKLRLTVSVPPGVTLVQGVPPQPVEYSFSIENEVKASEESAFVQTTPFGDVNVSMKRLRDIPTH